MRTFPKLEYLFGSYMNLPRFWTFFTRCCIFSWNLEHYLKWSATLGIIPKRFVLVPIPTLRVRQSDHFLFTFLIIPALILYISMLDTSEAWNSGSPFSYFSYCWQVHSENASTNRIEYRWAKCYEYSFLTMNFPCAEFRCCTQLHFSLSAKLFILSSFRGIVMAPIVCQARFWRYRTN